MTLESEMLFQLRAVGIEPLTQYKFHPTRKWKADFAILEKKLIIEVNGGTWMIKSGHTSGTGVSRDYEKGNAAQLLGWTYLQYTGKEIHDGTALQEIESYLGGDG